MLFILAVQYVYSQYSFKTSKLKESEIFNFFQKFSYDTGSRYLFKIENSNDFFLDFLSKSKHSELVPKNLYEGLNKESSKSWTKTKMLYFAVSNSVDCKYDHDLKQVLIGDPNEFKSLKNYLNSGNSKPVIIEKLFKTSGEGNNNSINSSRINELIFYVNINNVNKKFIDIFSNGVFTIKKEFDSESQASVLLQNCQMLLGIIIPSKDDIFVKKDVVEDNTGGNSGYNLYHIGIPGYVKRVILFNKMENKIISDVFVE